MTSEAPEVFVDFISIAGEDHERILSTGHGRILGTIMYVFFQDRAYIVQAALKFTVWLAEPDLMLPSP